MFKSRELNCRLKKYNIFTFIYSYIFTNCPYGEFIKKFSKLQKHVLDKKRE